MPCLRRCVAFPLISCMAICLATDAAAQNVEFSYSYSNLFDEGLSRVDGFSEFDMLLGIEEAFSAWSNYAPITFVERPDLGPPVSDDGYFPNGSPEIRIGHHSLSEDVLGHAFLPGSTGLDGDLHFDDSQRVWRDGSYLTVATHELGHAIGVAHFDGSRAIMNSELNAGNTFEALGQAFLFPQDIAAIQAIYGTGQGRVITKRSWSASDDGNSTLR